MWPGVASVPDTPPRSLNKNQSTTSQLSQQRKIISTNVEPITEVQKILTPAIPWMFVISSIALTILVECYSLNKWSECPRYH